MADHKFAAGQAVELHSNFRTGHKGGTFLVVRPLPADNSGNQYRVKSKSDGHERVAYETELSSSESELFLRS
jgi:hypothetical protein